MKEIILALDFDGTLYRLYDHDSEEMLMAQACEDEKDQEKMDEAISALRRGGDARAFEETLFSMIKGKSMSLISDTIRKVLRQTDPEEIEILKRIFSLENVHPCIISCGTDALIWEFLRATGLLPYVEGVFAKELFAKDGLISNMIWSVKGPEDKMKLALHLKKRLPGAVLFAVGDGFTDVPMLESADKGFLINYERKVRAEGRYKMINSFSDIELEIATL